MIERSRILLILAAAVFVPCATAADVAALDTIEVTGSNIRDIDLQDQHPIQILTHEDLLRTGLTGVADIVQQLVVANGQTSNRNSEAYGGGAPSVNLRSLGPNRTLLLVNGQRWVSALDSSVDLSSIPLPLVERIEILKDGASAVYGSDAIAGVINIITRRDFDGAQLGAQYGTSDHGDGTTRAFDVTFGRYGEKWSAAIGLQYGNDSAINSRDRALTAFPYAGLPLQASGGPFDVFIPPDFGAVSLTPGRSGTSPDDFHPFDPGVDRGFNFQQYTYLQAPESRHSVFAQARYEANSALAFSVDALFNRRESSSFAAPPVLYFDALDFVGPVAFIIPTENAYNPFGEPVPFVLERLSGLPARFSDQRFDTFWLHVGVDGVFDVASHDWLWKIDLTRARSNERDLGGPYARNDELEQALGPSFFDASGVAHCGTPDDVIAGCVPLNVFGGPGGATADADYFHYTLRENLQNQMTTVAAKTSGALFDLPAGAVNVAAGVEHRRLSGYDHPDPIEAAGLANGNSGFSFYGPTSGAYHVDEAFAEFDLPVLHEQALAESLDFTAADRFSKYSAFGGTNNAQFGLRWKPVSDVLVRANYGEGFRAPSINDLYGGTNYDTGSPQDPCVPIPDGEGGYFYQPSPAVAARCAKLGVPASAPAPPLITLTSGGNPDLHPETSRSRTIGVVVAPSAVPDLNMSQDWYDIQVRNAITQVFGQYFVDQCYLDDSDSACTHITRDASGEIAQVAANEINLPNGQEVEGYDFVLNYQRETAIGRWQLHWHAAYVSYFGEVGQPRRGKVLADNSIAEGNVAGMDPIWRLRSVATLQWDRAPWTASVTARYFSPLLEDCSNVVDTVGTTGDASLLNLCNDPSRTINGNPANRMPSVTYFDVTTGWRAPWGSLITLGIRNALDRDPPPSRFRGGGGETFVTDYDAPGRFYYVIIRQKF